MKKTSEYFIVFAFGAVLYGMAEVVFRGYTHWTMILLGGTVFSELYFIDFMLKEKNYILKCSIGSVMICAMEFLCGYVVNVQLKMKVWDYSGIKYNLLGQICPKYAAVWFMLCIPAFIISSLIRKKAICRKDLR